MNKCMYIYASTHAKGKKGRRRRGNAGRGRAGNRPFLHSTATSKAKLQRMKGRVVFRNMRGSGRGVRAGRRMKGEREREGERARERERASEREREGRRIGEREGGITYMYACCRLWSLGGQMQSQARNNTPYFTQKSGDGGGGGGPTIWRRP